MANMFSEQGLKYYQSLIQRQERRLRETGSEVGEEAGINCDWHDNFGYEDAKRRLELEASTLQRMKEEVSGAQILSIPEQSDKVAIGVTVRVSVDGNAKEYTIGAFGESDPDNGLIMYLSPLARCMMGLRQGDSRVFSVGGKKMEIEVEEILPPSHKYYSLLAHLIERTGEDS